MRTTFCMFPDLLRSLLEIVSRAVIIETRTVASPQAVFVIAMKKALPILAAMDSLAHIIQAPTIRVGKNLKESKLKPLERLANCHKNTKIK